MSVGIGLRWTTIALLAFVTINHAFGAGPDQEPIPSFYQEPGISPNRDAINHSAAEQIDPFTGKLQWHFSDISIPGNGGFTLSVQRSYSSRNEDYEPSPVGVGWTMHFGRILRKSGFALCDMSQTSAANNPVFESPNGSRSVLYVALDAASFITSSRWHATCDLGKMTLFSPEGTRYVMDVNGPAVGTDPARTQVSWYPSTITDRNGNSMTITYTFADTLTFGPQTVATSDGRNLTFTYANGVLTSVSDGSRSWNYAYEAIPGYPGGYNLITVTRPDSAAWQYTYNPPGAGPGFGTPGGFSMKSVTYPTGGRIDYTYGFVQFNPASFFPAATVVTHKTAGSDAWTYTYAPAINPLPICGASLCSIDPTTDADKLDKTTVAAPDGNSYVYQHIGYTSASPGYVYLIGTLLFKTSGSVQQEAYSWGGQTISNQSNVRPGGGYIADATTSAPVLFQKIVSRSGALYTTSFFDSTAAGLGFDAFGNPAKITEVGPDENGNNETRVTSVTYFTDPVKWIIHVKQDETTDTIGSITRTFDGNANMLAETRYGVGTTYTYSGAGDVLTKTDARGNVITYSGHSRGIPQSENHPEAVTISRTVSSTGNVLSETDGELATTSFAYDGLNRITSITHAAGNAVSVTWQPNSRTVTRGAYQEATTFDAFGRAVSVVHTGSADGPITQTFGYDPLGRKIFASYPNSARGTYSSFNAADQLVILLHDSDSTGTGATSGIGYAYSGANVTITNERGKQFVHKHRAWGDPQSAELMAITAPEPSASIAMQRNGLGKLTQATQDSVTRSYGYDGHYFLTSMTDPEVGTTVFGRDAVGNMTSRTVGANPATTFVYDGRNRLTSITYPAGTASVTRTYFKDDKLATVDNGIARRDFTYDANKNLTQEKLTTGAQIFTLGYAYDGNDALSTITYGSGKVVSYQPDALGRPTVALPYVTTVSHHPTGQISHMAYANGVTTDVALNNRNWPGRLTIAKSTSYFDMNYDYEANGNVTGITQAGDQDWTRTMTYDGVDRLQTVSGPWGGGSFTYDGRGNIRSQTLGTFSMSYNYDLATEKLLSTSGSKAYAFTYDAYGNVTANGFTTFGYNDASQMRCARCGQADEVDYEYDGLGQRTKTLQGGAATYFVTDANGRLMWERDPDGTIKEYVYLAGQQVATRTQAP